MMKKLFSILLLLAAVLTTASCGKDDSGGSTEDKGSTYRATALEFSEQISYVTAIKALDDRVYMIYDYYEDGETEEDYFSETKLVSFNGDGSDFSVIPYEIGESSYIQSMEIDNDGNIWLVEYTVSSASEDGGDTGEEANYTEVYKLVKIDNTGAMLSEKELAEVMSAGGDGMEAYLQSMAVDGEGNVYLCISRYSETEYSTDIVVLDSQGEQLTSITADNMDSFIKTSDGRILVSAYAEEGQELKEIDLSAGDFGDTFSMNTYYNSIFAGNDYDLYFSDGSNLYGHNLDSGETKTILNWLSSGISSSYLGSIVALSDGKFILANTNNSGKSEIMLLSPSGAGSDKTTLTLAAYYMDDALRSAIVDFNNTNEEYEIVATEYSIYDTEDDMWAGITKLSTELAAGNIPDILMLDNLPTEQYSKKGILEDLYQYIDNDEELNRDSFVSSLINTLETGGKLYELPVGFMLETVVANSDFVGTEMGWTFPDLLALSETLPDDVSIFGPYYTKSDFVDIIVMANSGQFIDWNTGECNFGDESFVKLLEFANTLPAEFEYDEDLSIDGSEQIANGKQVCMTTMLSSLEDIQVYDKMFNGKANYIGFPVSEGVGTSFYTRTSLGITSASEHKDVAWEFIRQFFVGDYILPEDGGMMFELPVSQAQFDTFVELAMEKELDEDGNEISTGGIGWGGSFSIELYAATQEDVDTFKTVLDSASGILRYDNSLSEIISEETEAFFAGAQTAERTAEIIQDRVTTYVNE